jgi:hypothetical protein
VAKKCTVSFVDFSAAFDSTSQVFVAEALLEAGASHKCVGTFRSMYSKAKARIRSTEADGSVTFTDYFDIRRGVVQGDCFSALAFVIAVESVMREHDPGGGVSALGRLVSRLEFEFADDIAVIDQGGANLISRSAWLVSEISGPVDRSVFTIAID